VPESCGSGGSALNLVDCAEDHRRGTLDGPADEVPGAVAVMYLGESAFDRAGPSGLGSLITQQYESGAVVPVQQGFGATVARGRK
jgi:hypothetical protein